jgi:hypothetical protein
MEQTINMSAQDALHAAKQKAEKEAKDPAAQQRVVIHQHH